MTKKNTLKEYIPLLDSIKIRTRRAQVRATLSANAEMLLLELGYGFAFVGRQYRIEVSNQDFYLGLLFYHLALRRFIVIELKKGRFQPEYAGKINFYCSAVDDLLRYSGDAATIGLILCQEKDKIIAEYSLRDMAKPISVSDYELTRTLPESFRSALRPSNRSKWNLNLPTSFRNRGGC